MILRPSRTPSGVWTEIFPILKVESLTHFSKGLAYKQANLKGPYKQDIKEQVTTINIKKDRLYMKSPTQETYVEVFFKFNPYLWC